MVLLQIRPVCLDGEWTLIELQVRVAAPPLRAEPACSTARFRVSGSADPTTAAATIALTVQPCRKPAQSQGEIEAGNGVAFDGNELGRLTYEKVWATAAL